MSTPGAYEVVKHAQAYRPYVAVGPAIGLCQVQTVDLYETGAGVPASVGSFASAPNLSDNRPRIDNGIGDVLRDHAVIRLPYLGSPSDSNNSMLIPQQSLLFAALIRPSRQSDLVFGQGAVSVDVMDVSARNQQSVMPLSINAQISIIEASAKPTTFGTIASHTVRGFYDPSLPGGATAFVKMSDEALASPAVQKAIAAAASQLTSAASERGDPQSYPYPRSPDDTSVWHRHVNAPYAGVETSSVDMFVATEGGAYILLSSEMVKAADTATDTVMADAERDWLVFMRQVSRDGTTPSALDSRFVRPAGLENARVSEGQRAKIEAWYTKWRGVAATAADPAAGTRRKDALWAEFRRRNPTSTITRAQFEANPATYLPDSTWTTSPAGVDREWWQTILSGLGWLGSSVVEPLASSGALTPLLGMAAVSGWFGDNIKWLVIGLGIIFVLK